MKFQCIIAFEVLSVTPLEGASSSSLPAVEIRILDAKNECNDTLELHDAPVLDSSSEPFDTGVEQEEEVEDD